MQRFTKKIDVRDVTYLFNGDILRIGIWQDNDRLHLIHPDGGSWAGIYGLMFRPSLTEEQIWFVLKNHAMFPDPGFHTFAIKNEEPIDIVTEAINDFKFIIDDPGDPDVGIFGGISEVRIQISPVCDAAGNQDAIDFWRQACVDFFDCQNVQLAP